MSIHLNDSTDTLTATAGSAWTIGTGALSAGVWVYWNSSPDVASEIINVRTSAGTFLFAPARMNNGSPTDKYAASNNTSDYIGTYQATSAWRWLVFTRPTGGSSTMRLRVFDDSTSNTPLSDENNTLNFGANITTAQQMHIGVNSGGQGSTNCYITNLKLHTGVEWTNAEARTEALYFGIQKSGGTDRLCWRLKDLTSTTDGLNEFGGSGPNFSNSGATTNASMPTNLGEFGGGGGGGGGSGASNNSRIIPSGIIPVTISPPGQPFRFTSI